ncbi:MAG: SGNH/GDSL hydrolase family protein [Proteobacteria bacterium]|nr:SGNH/GDSL hydrolase family protein [Pseudomonadota bacterium]
MLDRRIRARALSVLMVLGLTAAGAAAEAPSVVAFAGLEHYAAADVQLRTRPAAERQVVFIGDSITEAWSATDPSFFGRGRVNRGISGQTTAQMLLRFRQDVIELEPAVVHIMAGTNDIAGNAGPYDPGVTQGNLASMVDLALAHGIRVVLASVPPAARFDWRPSVQPGPPIAALNAWLRAYARSRGVVYVDYYSALSDGADGVSAELAPDGCHPSLQGYQRMSPLTEAAIERARRAPAARR